MLRQRELAEEGGGPSRAGQKNINATANTANISDVETAVINLWGPFCATQKKKNV